MAKKATIAAKVLYAVGGPNLLNAYWGKDRLTVLAYHRITDATDPAFPYYRPNVSADTATFARQMEYIKAKFNVVSLAQVGAFITKGEKLPPRPALITFDDGYLDNYQNAYPVLKGLGLPAVIFLMTSRMDHPAPPWWDECAYALHRTPHTAAALPLIGVVDLSTPAARQSATDALLRALKTVPEAEKLAHVRALWGTLDVQPPTTEPPLFVNWDQVRELVANGVACMPHTVNHPILTRIDTETARRELAESKAIIEQKTGQPCMGFAYPNGTPADYNETTFAILKELGYTAAFTLTPGPARLEQVRRLPFQIKRVFLIYKDSFEIFALKVMGLPAVAERFGF